MDPLDHLAGPAADLLSRVDQSLAIAGAPDGHPIWPLLRRLRTLPGAAVEAVAALRPAPFADAGHAVRGLLPEYDDAAAALAGGGSWAGAGADAYAAQRAALEAHLTGGPESLSGRLDATAGYADALADWVDHSRDALARTLGEVLTSAEAVAMVTAAPGGPLAPGGAVAPGSPVGRGSASSQGGVLAAAEIGARVLGAVAEAYDRGEELRQHWSPSLAELAFRPPVDTALRLDATTRISG
jgi:hypothetical protein